MKKAKERNNIIDILKGVAVISVLLGHALQRGLGLSGYIPFDNYIFKIIYTYHMPLFMILSGYVLANYTNKFDKEFLIKKSLRLLYPTIIWSYLIWSVRNFNFVGIKEFIPFPNSLIEYTKTLIKHPDFIIWFLYVVFIFNLFFYIIKKINKKEDIYLDVTFSIAFYLLLGVIPNSNFGIYNIQLYFPIFAFGYYLKKEYLKKYSWKYILSFIIIYIVLLYKCADTFLYNHFEYYLISFSAIFLIYQLIIRIKEFKICNLLSFFGKYSLEIYLCQCLCLNIGIGQGYLRVLTIFISATTISVLLSIITNKFNVIKMILYGKFKYLKNK